ncbi:calcium, potassium:sodium antiporter [Aureococcus anophagefferens]|nr:calcium, potassium:sodium antiporter [Aureococcus anophagefferens]
MEITDVEARCSGSSGGGDASGLDPSPVETARALSRGQPPVPRRRRHRQKRKVFWKASAVLALCAVGVTYAHGPGAVDALRSALTHTPARWRLGAKKSICKSVYEKIAEDWGLSDDVSGATLMAAGGSAPELATSFIGTFQGSTVGLGTIVGSAVFNVLFVIGMCALATPKELGPLKLTWWPLARDCCYYILTLGTLASFFTTTSTGLITGAEAGIQFSLYFGYVFLMSQNAKLESWVKRKLAKEERYKMNAGIAVVARIKGDVSGVRLVGRGPQRSLDAGEFRKILGLLGDATDLTTASPGDALATVLLLPLNGSLALTVPDCRVIGNEHYCYLSFVCSIAWIGAYSFGMVECIVSIGCFTGIPIFIMGLTFLAAGTSVPDLLSSVAVAKQGKGDMAVSSSIGSNQGSKRERNSQFQRLRSRPFSTRSNIVDVAVGLPLPWLAFTLVHGCPVPVGGHANGNALSVAILLAMVAAVIIAIAASGWKMSKGLGFTSGARRQAPEPPKKQLSPREALVEALPARCAYPDEESGETYDTSLVGKIEAVAALRARPRTDGELVDMLCGRPWTLRFTSSPSFAFNKGFTGVAGTLPGGASSRGWRSPSSRRGANTATYVEVVLPKVALPGQAAAPLDVNVQADWGSSAASAAARKDQVYLGAVGAPSNAGPCPSTASAYARLEGHARHELLAVEYIDDDLRVMKGTAAWFVFRGRRVA